MKSNHFGIKFTHYCETSIEELYILESILKLTKESCIDKEINNIYYNLPQTKQFILSQERNNYINMLSIAIEKIEDLKQIQTSIELIYEKN